MEATCLIKGYSHFSQGATRWTEVVIPVLLAVLPPSTIISRADIGLEHSLLLQLVHRRVVLLSRVAQVDAAFLQSLAQCLRLQLKVLVDSERRT